MDWSGQEVYLRGFFCNVEERLWWASVGADTEDYKNFISLDISVLSHEKSCLEVFEIRKKSLHLHPQTKKNQEIFNEHNHT